MELLRGETLTELFVRNGGPLDAATVQQIGIQITGVVERFVAQGTDRPEAEIAGEPGVAPEHLVLRGPRVARARYS